LAARYRGDAYAPLTTPGSIRSLHGSFACPISRELADRDPPKPALYPFVEPVNGTTMSSSTAGCAGDSFHERRIQFPDRSPAHGKPVSVWPGYVETDKRFATGLFVPTRDDINSLLQLHLCGSRRQSFLDFHKKLG
jgi:hypothetical protein